MSGRWFQASASQPPPSHVQGDTQDVAKTQINCDPSCGQGHQGAMTELFPYGGKHRGYR